MTETTFGDLLKEYDMCVLRSQEFEKVQLRLRQERFAIMEKAEEMTAAILDRECEAMRESKKYSQRALIIGSVLETYDELIRH